MKNYEGVLKAVLRDIKPSEEVPAAIQKQLEAINKALSKKDIKATAVVGGSLAKGTHLKGDHDVDVFVKFGLKHKSHNLSDLLFDAIKSMKPERIHGSRDYFQIHKSKLTYEIVPVLDIKQAKQSQNVTDFSPWHVEWVKKNGKDLKEDIRLAKKFCKAAKVYGAESYIRGFSGHVLDILVISAGGFIPLLESALNWKPKVVVDIEDH